MFDWIKGKDEIDSFHEWVDDISPEELRERRKTYFRYSQYVKYRFGKDYQNFDPPIEEDELEFYRQKFNERMDLVKRREERKRKSYENELLEEQGYFVWDPVEPRPPRRTKWMRFKKGKKGFVFVLRPFN